MKRKMRFHSYGVMLFPSTPVCDSIISNSRANKWRNGIASSTTPDWGGVVHLGFHVT
jgi:hypothetical protein